MLVFQQSQTILCKSRTAFWFPFLLGFFRFFNLFWATSSATKSCPSSSRLSVSLRNCQFALFEFSMRRSWTLSSSFNFLASLLAASSIRISSVIFSWSSVFWDSLWAAFSLGNGWLACPSCVTDAGSAHGSNPSVGVRLCVQKTETIL